MKPSRSLTMLNDTLGSPVPEELGDTADVSVGTVRIDNRGRPFRATRATPFSRTVWSRRWFETATERRFRQRMSDVLTNLGFVYFGVLLGIESVIAFEGGHGSLVLQHPTSLLIGAAMIVLPRAYAGLFCSYPVDDPRVA